MANKPPRAGQRWTKQEVSQMRKLAKGNTPTGLIAYELGRSEASVYSKVSDENITLKPTNQSPYNRRKKR